MAGIAGIVDRNPQTVTRMLDRLSHRGAAGSKVVERNGITLGAVWPQAQVVPISRTLRLRAAWDGQRPPLPEPQQLEHAGAPFALAMAQARQTLFLARDPLGICPLYYGYTDSAQLCFASEVKALLEATSDVHEFPPGAWYTPGTGMRAYAPRATAHVAAADTTATLLDLRLRLERAVCRHIKGAEMGAWLSGGVDSSAIVALARPHVQTLHTFAAGLAGAPDLKYAQEAADFLNTTHHTVTVTFPQVLAALPATIYHLESFDALLVRSAITNYLVAEVAADYVNTAFSGEGADELFAGYHYLRDLPPEQLAGELQVLPQRLHNTALQRVDRSAAAHGLVVHVPFLDHEVVAVAVRIPSRLKLRRSNRITEKWILRQALVGLLPEAVLWRRKAKFWQGTGLDDLLETHASETISDADFRRERQLPNGWKLNTKEELLYYRIFREHFGELGNLDWMGRTKGAPQH